MFSQHDLSITQPFHVPFLKVLAHEAKCQKVGRERLVLAFREHKTNPVNDSFSSRCSAELLLHHPVLQTKPIPIVALPQYSQEFVANMHKNHKLPISVRLNDKKLRAAYGFDEGQCLDVDIDLWKEQAIHKTVDELVRRPFSP